MGCGMGLIKYLLFFFNFIFALCGLALLILGVLVRVKANSYSETLSENVTFPSTTLIVIGSIIFIIAFFGCCGAIRESNCMVITFACFLLTILLIQVAIAIYAFMTLNKSESYDIEGPYQKIFDGYWRDATDREVIDAAQSSLSCCGVHGPNDYNRLGWNGTIPNSCCTILHAGEQCNANQKYFHKEGCIESLKTALAYLGNLLGGVAIGVVAVEFVGIIFALCLSNSIRNAERRGYRV